MADSIYISQLDSKAASLSSLWSVVISLLYKLAYCLAYILTALSSQYEVPGIICSLLHRAWFMSSHAWGEIGCNYDVGKGKAEITFITHAGYV
jgi:hypothetical protein